MPSNADLPPLETYLVGGTVRDELLGLPDRGDRDWVVVGATPGDMLARGFKRVGKGFPVFLLPDRPGHIWALARTERKTGPGHGGFAFDADAAVTLEEDLRRRDLTINAIARTDDGRLIDPHGGRADLDRRVLRHVSEAFVEDPLRVLRVARFAAALGGLGFTVADETLALMRGMSAGGELRTLPGERVWQEMERALGSPAPQAFVRTLRECGALKVVLPEVDRLFGVPQPARWHPEIDTGVHTLMCLEQAARLGGGAEVAWAVLVHDIGKGVTDPARWPSHSGHETLGLPLLENIARRLPVPKIHARLAALVCEHHTKMHRIRRLRPKTLLALLNALDAFRRPRRMERFLLACEADARGRAGLEDRDYPQRDYLQAMRRAAAGVDHRKLLAEHPDGDPGRLIERRRIQAIAAAAERADAG